MLQNLVVLFCLRGTSQSYSYRTSKNGQPVVGNALAANRIKIVDQLLMCGRTDTDRHLAAPITQK